MPPALDAFASENYEVAAELAAEAKRHASRSSMVRELLGLSLYHLDRWSEAAAELLAFRRLTNRVDQNHVIADCYRATGRYERALEICNEVAQKQVTPEVWAEVNMVAAGAHTSLGQPDKALARLSRADLNPRSVEPYHLRLWYVRADLLEKAGNEEAARGAWERLVQEDPDFFDASERLSRSN